MTTHSSQASERRGDQAGLPRRMSSCGLTVLPACACLLIFSSFTFGVGVGEILFQDDFTGKLGEGWSWVREHPGAWRVTPRGLEVRIEPGNMWGPANDARNVLVRPAPDTTNRGIEISVKIENQPSHQYEQVDLVWYYDDSNMVKLGQELVDGKLSVVMGREEKDKTRTVAIMPLESTTVRLRLFIKGVSIRGQFREADNAEWRNVGECSLPAPADSRAKISLQFYQGAVGVDHWARATDFRVLAAE
jgi:regulation of enolase protein 1 (concanavalin A-like superfamily)